MVRLAGIEPATPGLGMRFKAVCCILLRCEMLYLSVFLFYKIVQECAHTCSVPGYTCRSGGKFVGI